jgi:hypothetical protein
MKSRIFSLRQILFTAFLVITLQYECFSQEADSSIIRRPGMFIGFSLGPSQTNIIFTETSTVSGLLSGKKNSFTGSLDFGYLFSRYFGLSAGIGYNTYSTQLSLSTYQNTFDAVDSEDEAYELQVSGSGINEEQKISFLSVPVCLNIRLPFSKNIGFFLQPGINLMYPLSKNYKSSGIFTYKGYYPAYNVLLEDLPDYGFPSDLSIESEGKPELKTLSFNAIVSAGFDFLIQNKYQIGVAACYDRSLSGISNYPSYDKFQLTSDVNQINSLMGGSSNTTVEAISIKIVFRYYLK